MAVKSGVNVFMTKPVSFKEVEKFLDVWVKDVSQVDIV
jgi:hypothetical protein